MKKILFLVLVLSSVTAWGQGVGQGFTPSVGTVDSTRLDTTGGVSVLKYWRDGVFVRGDTIPPDEVSGFLNRIETGNTKVRVSEDSIISEIEGKLFSYFVIKDAGKDVVVLNAGINYLDPANSGAAWISGGTNGTSTRTLGALSITGKAINQIIGDNELRMILGGYDNSIDDIIASGIIQSHHSAIGPGGGGHNTIVGGSSHLIEGAGYVGIFSGTQNIFRTGGFAFSGGSRSDSLTGEFIASLGNDDVTIRGTDNIVVLASKESIVESSTYTVVLANFQGVAEGDYNFLSGLRGTIYGNGNSNTGARNDIGLSGVAGSNYNHVHGTFCSVGLTSPSEHNDVTGESHEVDGAHNSVSGFDNTIIGNENWAAGELIQLTTSNSAGWGRNIVVTGLYSWSGNRNNTVSANYASILAGLNLTNGRDFTALTQNIEVAEFYYDRRGSKGTPGEILSTDAAGTDWVGVGTLPMTNPQGGAATVQGSVNSLDTAIDALEALVRAGSGSPEASVTAPPGTLYLNTAGGANTTLYVKESGTGNTGWVAK